MEAAIRDFIFYIHHTRRAASNTELSYQRDLKKLTEWCTERGIHQVTQITEQNLQEYFQYMEDCHFAASTISRNIASVRAFFQYLWTERRIQKDPSEALHPPKVQKKTPGILSVHDVDLLLKQPDIRTPKGLRDKAMLELLYATGMRVSELIHLKLPDLNLNSNYVTCREAGRERMIPFGTVCKKALHRYLEKGRKVFTQKEDIPELFPNCSGKSMSRQGFWKVLKGYADAAGIQGDITPHTLRHSFAVHMLQNGADIKNVQEMLGHADLSTTQLYLNLDTKKMQEMYQKTHPRG